MYKDHINKFQYQLIILNEKKRIAHNLKLCLQQLKDLNAASSASSSSSVQSSDITFDVHAMEAYQSEINNAIEALSNKVALLNHLNQFGEMNPEVVNYESFEEYKSLFNKFSSKPLNLTYEQYLILKTDKKNEIWNSARDHIRDEIESIKKTIEGALIAECPHYVDTRERSGELIENVIENIDVILLNNASLSEDCKGHIQTLLQSYKNNKDYISFQQATALWVLLRQLDEGVKLDEADRSAFRFMLTQCPWDKREELIGSLTKLSKLEADTSWPYYSTILFGTLFALAWLLAVAVCALVVAGTVILGVKGFTARAHDHTHVHGEPQAGAANIAFFIILNSSCIAPIAAIGVLYSAFRLICLPFEVYQKAQGKCQQYESEVSGLISRVKYEQQQLIYYQQEFPDFHNDKIFTLRENANQLGRRHRINRSSRLFKEAMDSVSSLKSSMDIASIVDKQIDECDSEQKEKARVQQSISEFLT